MKFRSYASASVGIAVISLLSCSCDWSGGSSDDFNTSSGSTTVNISGFYSGILGSGLAVSRTSGGNISSLTLQQSGNALDVIDSNGQNYKGNVGSPLTLAAPSDLGVIPTGAQVASFQVSWAGKDGVAARDVSFSGVISVVTVDSIQGDSTTTSSIDDSVRVAQNDNVRTATTDNTRNSDTFNNSGNSTVNDQNSTTTVNGDQGTTFSDVTTTTVTTVNNGQQPGTDDMGNPTVEGTDSTTTQVTINGSSNNSNSAVNSVNGSVGNQNSASGSNATTANNSNVNNVNTQTTSDGRTSTDNVTTTTENTFLLTDANSQYRLRGSWVENEGVVGQVDAIAAGAGGFISTTTTN